MNIKALVWFLIGAAAVLATSAWLVAELVISIVSALALQS